MEAIISIMEMIFIISIIVFINVFKNSNKENQKTIVKEKEFNCTYYFPNH